MWSWLYHPPKEHTDDDSHDESYTPSDDDSDDDMPELVRRSDTNDSGDDSDSDSDDEKSLEDVALLNEQPNDIWIGDSGASCHLVNDDTYMYDVKIIKEMIKIGNGVGIEATKVGKIKAKFIQKNRDEHFLTNRFKRID